jgi:hypothetical protein
MDTDFANAPPLKRDYSYETHVSTSEIVRKVECGINISDFFHEYKARNIDLEYTLL